MRASEGGDGRKLRGFESRQGFCSRRAGVVELVLVWCAKKVSERVGEWVNESVSG